MNIASAPPHVEGDMEVHHACLICGSKIKFEKSFIQQHLQLMHQTNIGNYRKQFSAEFDVIFANLGDKRNRLSELSSGVTESLKYEWDQCLRHCHICGKMHNCAAKLYFHLGHVHDMSMSSAPAHVKGDVKVFHACLICGKKIKFERFFIRRHLQGMHDISMENYEQQFSAELDSQKGKLS